MTVFKGYMRIIKKCLPSIAVHFFVTMAITIGIQIALQGTTRQAFEATSLKVGIVDEDGSSLAKGLIEYIGQVHDVEMLENDEGVIREKLYYQNIMYVIRIPSHFERVSLQEEQPLKVTGIPNEFGAFYVEQRVDAFLNGMLVYMKAGYSLDDSIQLILKAGVDEAKVQLIDINGRGGVRADYTYMLEYLPYLFIAAFCSSLGVVMGVFNNKETKRKMLSSPQSLKRQNLEQLLAFGVTGIGFMVVTFVVLTAVYGFGFWQSEHLTYYLGNVISLLLVSLAIAFAVGIVIKKADAIASGTTVVSLALCFLGGVFVPLELMGESVKRVSRFLPTYWYESNLQILIDRNFLTPELRVEIFKGYGLQLVFAVACMAVALAVVKYRSQER